MLTPLVVSPRRRASALFLVVGLALVVPHGQGRADPGERAEREGGGRAAASDRADEKRYRVMVYDRTDREWSTHSTYKNRESARLLAEQMWNAVAAGPMDEELKNVGTKVRDNKFVVERTEYGSVLGQALTDDLASWRRGMKVLDAGAGQAGFFRTLRDGRDARHTPEMVAIGATRPSGVSDADLAGITYHEGLLGHDGKLERTLGRGTFDRIVDTYGASHYSPRLDRMVEAYGELLKPGGKVFLHFRDQNLAIKDADGKRVEAVDWLRRVEGLRLIGKPEPNGDGGFSVVLERRGRRAVRAPALELTDFVSSGPPLRFYREVQGERGRGDEGRRHGWFDRLRGR